MVPKVLGSKLEYALLEKGIRPTDLARLAGVSKSTVTQWLKGKHLSVGALIKISDSLELSLNWFLLDFGSLASTEDLQISTEEREFLDVLNYIDNDISCVGNFIHCLNDYNSNTSNLTGLFGAEKIFSHTDTAQFIVALDGVLLSCNEFFIDLFGLVDVDIIGAGFNCYDLVHNDYLPYIKRSKEDTLSNGTGAGGYRSLAMLNYTDKSRIPVIGKASIIEYRNKSALEIILKRVNH